MKPKPRYQPGDRIGDRYQVHKALMGGMGEVYLCLDLEERLPAALKTFQTKHITNFVDLSGRLKSLPKYFTDELTIWIALEKHPNIVRCYNITIQDGIPFIVLEWVAGDARIGVSLREWITSGQIPLKLILHFIVDVCQGMIYAQKKQPGLVHQDLKPENILVSRENIAKITDFGLARLVQRNVLTPEIEDQKVSQQRAGGTPLYMAPEQWQGREVEQRTDIYAVGCILYELLTGHPPFRASTLKILREKHLKEEFTELPDKLSQASALNSLLYRCLAKDKSERFTSFQEIVTEITNIYSQQFGETLDLQISLGHFSASDFTNRGTTYGMLKEYEAAFSDYEQALQLDPESVYVYLNRGVIHEELGETERAIVDYDQAIALNPDWHVPYYNRGNLYYDMAQYEQALDDFTRALELNPELAVAYNALGNTYNKLGKSEAALSCLNHAIQLKPENGLYLRNRGNFHYYRQQYEDAISDFTRAIKAEPDFFEAYIKRGSSFAQLGNEKRALLDYRQATEIDPTDTQGMYLRGNSYLKLQQYEQALEFLTLAIGIDPANYKAFSSRGATHYYLQNYKQSLADCNRAIQLNHQYAVAYFNRGTTYAALQQYELALNDFEQTVNLDPNYALAYVNTGALLSNLDQLREALPYFEKAAALGHAQGAQYAIQVREMLGEVAKPATSLGQEAFDAFQQADSPMAMAQAVAQYSFMVDGEFMAIVEQVTRQQVPPAQRQAFEQRLAWLRQIAKEQNP